MPQAVAGSQAASKAPMEPTLPGAAGKRPQPNQVANTNAARRLFTGIGIGVRSGRIQVLVGFRKRPGNRVCLG